MRFLVATTLLSTTALAQQPGAPAAPATSIAARTAGMQKLDGFFPLYWDEPTGSLFLEIPRLNDEFLYQIGLSAGLGSNDIGLDRAQLGDTKIVRFERVGPKVLMVQPNYDYRAVSTSALERQRVADAFATSVLWGFTIAAESDGRLLVDATLELDLVARVDPVGVVDLGVVRPDLGPVPGVAQVLLRQIPERVATHDGVRGAVRVDAHLAGLASRSVRGGLTALGAFSVSPSSLPLLLSSPSEAFSAFAAAFFSTEELFLAFAAQACWVLAPISVSVAATAQ